MVTTKRILVDVDGVLADLVAKVAKLVKRTPEDFTSYSFSESVTPRESERIHRAMCREGFCKRVPWYPDAQTFVKCLRDLGEVVAVTKPFHASPTWVYERQGWLEGHVDKTVHTAHKALVRGDVLIEDSIENCLEWLDEHPKSTAILIDRPWNRLDFGVPTDANMLRVKNYTEALRKVNRAL